MRRFCYASISLFIGYSALQAASAISACSWLGGSGNDDCVVGVRILSQGNIALAANINDASPGGLQPVLLNGATAATSGAIIILNSTGQKVISVTRCADEVLDMAIDGGDNIYVAAGDDGLIKINSQVSQVLTKSTVEGFCMRIDAAQDGSCAALRNAMNSDRSEGSGPGMIYVFNSDGSRSAYFAGMHKTQDIAIDNTAGLVFSTGYNVTHSGCNPVHVAYVKAHDFAGNERWKDYDWPGTMLDDCDGDGYENNMADTRGYRVSVGRDGKLYCSFECAGGNHIFRRDPRDIKMAVSIVGGDMWHSFHDTKSEHKIFFGRYDIETGNYILGQQMCTRWYGIDPNQGKNRLIDWGNTMRAREGNIIADESGNVYLGGECASGLPMPFVHGYEEKDGQIAYNPFDSAVYAGGAYAVFMNSALDSRIYCTRLSGGTSRDIDARIVNGNLIVAWGGNAGMLGTNFKDNPEWLLDTHNAIQPQRGGGDGEGFFAVIEANAGASINLKDNDWLTEQRSDFSAFVAQNRLVVEVRHPLPSSAALSIFTASGRRCMKSSIMPGEMRKEFLFSHSGGLFIAEIKWCATSLSRIVTVR